MAICTHPVTVRRAAIDLRCPLCMDADLDRALDDNARLRLDTDRLIHEIERLRAENTTLQERNAELYRAQKNMFLSLKANGETIARLVLEQSSKNT